MRYRKKDTRLEHIETPSFIYNVVRRTKFITAKQPQWRVLVTLEYYERLYNEHSMVV